MRKQEICSHIIIHRLPGVCLRLLTRWVRLAVASAQQRKALPLAFPLPTLEEGQPGLSGPSTINHYKEDFGKARDQVSLIHMQFARPRLERKPMALAPRLTHSYPGLRVSLPR